MARKLRIAVSVFFGLLVVALSVLWVRSFRINEIVARLDDNGALITLGSNYGHAYFCRRELKHENGHPWRYWQVPAVRAASMIDRNYFSSIDMLVLPYWCLIADVGIAAATPWFPRRFSLRTLLIATTLVTVVLGLAVCAGR